MKNVTIGIYLITEKATGKMYVGLAGGRDGIEGRWKFHKSFRGNYPENFFSYEILHPCPYGTTRAELSRLEKFYIRELDCMEPNGFNRTSGGTRSTEVSEATRKKHSESKKGKPPNNAGKPQSEEAKRKKSETLKGRVRGPMSEEHKKNISTGKKGKSSPGLRNPKGPMSEERKKKQSEAQKGRVKGPMSEEQKAKQSAAMKGKNKGKPLSPETRAKMSASKKGVKRRPMSEEEKAKRSAALKGRAPSNKGKRMSEETRAKCSAAKKGVPISEETRSKMSAAQKARVRDSMSEETKAKISAAAKARAALKRAAMADIDTVLEVELAFENNSH